MGHHSLPDAGQMRAAATLATAPGRKRQHTRAQEPRCHRKSTPEPPHRLLHAQPRALEMAIRRLSPGACLERIRGQWKHRERRAARRPHGVEAPQVLVERHADRVRVAYRRDTTDRAGCRRAHELLIRARKRLAQLRGDLRFAHPVVAARRDDDRLTGPGAAKEDHLRDAADRASDRGAGFGAGASGLRELDDGAPLTEPPPPRPVPTAGWRGRALRQSSH